VALQPHGLSHHHSLHCWEVYLLSLQINPGEKVEEGIQNVQRYLERGKGLQGLHAAELCDLSRAAGQLKLG